MRIGKELYSYKPDASSRLPKEMRTYELLEKLEIPFQGIDHDPANSAEVCGDIEAVLGIEICKNLFLRNQNKTEFYLLMMVSSKKFVTKEISKQIGASRLSFGEAEYMEKFLDITPGSVSVLGLMNDKDHMVRLLMDREIAEAVYLGCHPCINTSSLKIKISDIMEKFLPYTGHKPTIVDI